VKKNKLGFSLMEVLISLAIILILSAIAIPSYTHHITQANRSEAEIALSKLAVALEQYFTLNNTYKNSTLDVSTFSPKNYALEITSATTTSFLLTAIPSATQAKQDTECGTLTLNSSGEKGIKGSSTLEECW
jgi:type IV pilus assembly protein PilE